MALHKTTDFSCHVDCPAKMVVDKKERENTALARCSREMEYGRRFRPVDNLGLVSNFNRKPRSFGIFARQSILNQHVGQAIM